MSLSFLHPALLWGLAAALLPLLVHLFFRRRPRPTPFPAIELVLRAHRRTEKRLRLRRVALFTARTLLLAAVALALARPEVRRTGQAASGAGGGPSAVALVLDASGSMRYRLGGGTLLERARKDLLAALEGLGADEPASVVVCGGPAAPVASPPGFDRETQRRLLSEAQAIAGWSDLGACAGAGALALAEGAAAGVAGKRLVIATDLAASAWRLDAPAPLVERPGGPVRPEVAVLDATRGADLPNRAVAGLAVEPDPAAGVRGYRVSVTATSFAGAASGSSRGRGGGSADLELQLRAGGREAPVALRSYAQLAEGGAAHKELAWSFPAGGPTPLTVTLAPGDAQELDDARSAVVNVPREVRALVVNGAPSAVRHRDEAFFVEAALGSPASPVRTTVVDPGGLATAHLSAFDVVFLLGVPAPGAARAAELQDFVERGGGLFVSLGDGVDPERYDAELGALLPRLLHVVKTVADPAAPRPGERPARFAEVDWSHPALSVFSGQAREGFLGAQTFRYALLRPAAQGEGGRVLVSFDDGAPALVEGRRGAGRVVLFTSTVDRSWSDWPIRTSFLPAMQRLAGYLAGSLAERSDVPTVVLAPHPLAPQEGQQLLSAVGPDGRDRPLAARVAGDSPTVVPDLPGLWQVRVQEGGAARVDPRLAFAVWPDLRESDTSRLDPRELTAWFGGEAHARVASDGAASRPPLPLWSLLLALGLLAFLFEGLLLREGRPGGVRRPGGQSGLRQIAAPSSSRSR